VLSEAIGKLQSEQSSLAELEGEKHRVQEELTVTTATAMTISQIRVTQQYVNHLNRQISLKASDVQQAQRHVEQRQQVLTDKMLDEKVWAKARQKAFETHTALTLKKEQQELDEIASVRFLRSTY
jgi:flagellar FliJ protein